MPKPAISDETYRAAAERLVCENPIIKIEYYGAVERVPDGGAFVEARIWVAREQTVTAEPRGEL